jgi:hypothetical protein
MRQRDLVIRVLSSEAPILYSIMPTCSFRLFVLLYCTLLYCTIFFGVALVLIMGIGGPSQSVGDLLYASWLAFLVSLGIGMTCYEEINRDELA